MRGILTNPAYTGKLCVGRRRSRPPRTRRSATHPLGKPARSTDFTPPEEWTFLGSIPALVTEEIFDQVKQKRKRPKWAAVIIAQRREIEEGVRTESDYGCGCRNRRL